MKARRVMTASAALLQNIIHGFTGLRIQQQGLIRAYPPMLPAAWTASTPRHIRFHGQEDDIELHRDAQGKVNLTRHTL